MSKKRLETNPIRILDSKEQEDQSIIKNAPIIKELLTDSEKEDFNMLLSNLDTLNIKYEKPLSSAGIRLLQRKLLLKSQLEAISRKMLYVGRAI